MKKIVCIILLVLMWSCTSSKKMSIRDVNFSDIDQQLISKNNIKKSYLIPDFQGGNFKKQDTIAMREYNKNGNIISEYWKGFLYSTNVKYQYDTLNLLTQKNYATDFEIEFNYNYIFNPDSLILYQNYVDGSYDKNINNQKPKTSGIYKFNKNGFIVESYLYRDNDVDNEKKYITKYVYDSLNLLIAKKVDVELKEEQSQKKYKPYQNTTYYYTDKKIDSSITYSYNRSLEEFKRKTIYDTNGLIRSTIDSDTLIIFHKYLK